MQEVPTPSVFAQAVSRHDPFSVMEDRLRQASFQKERARAVRRLVPVAHTPS
jgi:hypothetical protein